MLDCQLLTAINSVFVATYLVSSSLRLLFLRGLIVANCKLSFSPQLIFQKGWVAWEPAQLHSGNPKSQEDIWQRPKSWRLIARQCGALRLQRSSQGQLRRTNTELLQVKRRPEVEIVTAWSCSYLTQNGRLVEGCVYGREGWRNLF